MTKHIENPSGLPYVAFSPLEDGESPQTVPEVRLQKVDDLRTAQFSMDPYELGTLAQTQTPGIQEALARNVHTDSQTLDDIAYNSVAAPAPDSRVAERVQTSIARHRNVGENALEVLSTSPLDLTRYAVADNPTAHSGVTLDLLSQDKYFPVRAAVGRNPSTDSATLRRLAQDHDSDVRQSVAGNPNTPADELERMSRSDGFTMAKVASNPSTPVEALRLLSRDTSTGNQTRAMVAKNPAAPTEVIASSVGSEDSWVREHAASNPKLDGSQRSTLAADSDQRVRRALARSAHAGEQLSVLSRDRDDFVRSTAAKNPTVDASTLEAMSSDSFHAVRSAVAENPNTSVPVLTKLAREDGVVGRVAQQQLSSRDELI